MKNYIDKDNRVFAFESNGSQDNLIKDGMTQISDADLAVLRASTPKEAEEKRVAEIKQAAGDLILSRHPIYKQSNMHAAMLELVDKKISSTLTKSEQATFDKLKAVWVWVQAVRTKSNEAEADGSQADDIVWPGV